MTKCVKENEFSSASVCSTAIALHLTIFDENRNRATVCLVQYYLIIKLRFHFYFSKYESRRWALISAGSLHMAFVQWLIAHWIKWQQIWWKPDTWSHLLDSVQFTTLWRLFTGHRGYWCCSCMRLESVAITNAPRMIIKNRNKMNPKWTTVCFIGLMSKILFLYVKRKHHTMSMYRYPATSGPPIYPDRNPSPQHTSNAKFTRLRHKHTHAYSRHRLNYSFYYLLFGHFLCVWQFNGTYHKSTMNRLIFSMFSFRLWIILFREREKRMEKNSYFFLPDSRPNWNVNNNGRAVWQFPYVCCRNQHKHTRIDGDRSMDRSMLLCGFL